MSSTSYWNTDDTPQDSAPTSAADLAAPDQALSDQATMALPKLSDADAMPTDAPASEASRKRAKRRPATAKRRRRVAKRTIEDVLGGSSSRARKTSAQIARKRRLKRRLRGQLDHSPSPAQATDAAQPEDKGVDKAPSKDAATETERDRAIGAKKRRRKASGSEGPRKVRRRRRRRPGSDTAAAVRDEAPASADGAPAAKRKRRRRKVARHLSDEQRKTGKRAEAKHLAKDTGQGGSTHGKGAHKEPVVNEPTPAIKRLGAAVLAIPAAIGRLFARIRDAVIKYHRTPQFRACVAVLVLYVLLSLFFSWRYLPGTTINGRPASLRTANAVAPRLSAVSEYETQVSGEGIELALTGADLGLELNREAFVQEAAAYLPSFAWPAQLLEARDFEVAHAISFDEQALATALGRQVSAANRHATPTKDATLGYDAKAEDFVVTTEEQGDMLGFSLTLDLVAHGIETLQNTITVDASAYVQPATRAADPRMQHALHDARGLLHEQVNLMIEGKRVYTIPSTLLRKWIIVGKDYGLTGDKGAITEWADGVLAYKLNTVGTTRTFTRTDDGKRVEVSGGTYGWAIDSSKLAELLCEHINALSADDVEVPMQGKGVDYVLGGQDWGNRYVDIDLSEQYVRLFDEDSELIWSSECVTGNISEGHDTVLGVFSIQDKEPNATLTGLDYDYDGEPDYENVVGYWMPFYGGYGLHDALWRDYFGYDAFVYDGSHGCVNLPYYAAQLLFELVEIGDPVIVHW